MNILFACHRYPFPPNRGGKIRPFNMIRHLSEQHRVTVATVAHSREEVQEGEGLRPYCAEVLYDIVPSAARWLRAAATLPFPPASSVAYFRSPKLISQVREVASKLPFDCVIVHCAFAAQFVEGVSASFRMMDFGDLDSGKWQDYARECALPLGAAYAWEAKKLRRYELRMARAFNVCTFTAPGELEQFRTLAPQRASELIPNGVDSKYFRLRERRIERPPVIVFLGRMDYFPNVKGAAWFANRVFPLVQQCRPDAQFRIVGSQPTAGIRALARNPGVKVTGSVPDVRDFMNDAAVSVVPLVLARGTQNKILECMALGVPVVSSHEAAKGVQAVAQRDYMLASAPEEWAAAVLRLIQDPDLEQRLAVSARRQVEEAHHWTTSMAKLDSLLARYVRSGNPAPMAN